MEHETLANHLPRRDTFLGISLAAGYRLGVQKLQSTVTDALRFLAVA